MIKKLLIVFGALIAIVALALATYDWTESKSWQRYLSKLRAAGEPLTFAEIQARRTLTPTTGPTSAGIVARVAEKVEKAPGPISRGVLGIEGPEIDFFKGIPRDAIETTRRYMEPRRSALAGLEAIQGLPPGCFEISYGGPPSELFTAFIEQRPRIQRVTKLLHLDSTLRLIDNEIEEAAAVIPKLLDIVAPLAEEPAGMADLLRIGTAALAVRVLENALRVGTLDTGTLQQLDDEFAELVDSYSLKWALWGERAQFIAAVDGIRSAVPVPGASLLATYADEKRGTELLGKLIQAGDEPAKLLAAKQEVETALAELPRRHRFTGMHLAFIPRLVTLHLRCLAEIRAARVAIAAERYRLAVGRLPTTLDELVPEYLPEIPTDPFDSAPIRFTRQDDILVFYTVGSDGEDDGGHVAPDEGEDRPRDRGFRLLPEARRGLVLIEKDRAEQAP